MSEQERDNGQDVRNAETMSAEELLKAFSAAEARDAKYGGGWDTHSAPFRTEILRRMSTGNTQGEGSGRYAPCGCGKCPNERYDSGIEAEQRDGRIEAGKGADRWPLADTCACELAEGLSVDTMHGPAYCEERLERGYRRVYADTQPERSDGRVSEESGDNGRKGGNAELVTVIGWCGESDDTHPRDMGTWQLVHDAEFRRQEDKISGVTQDEETVNTIKMAAEYLNRQDKP